jgi:hypothetical protein
LLHVKTIAFALFGLLAVSAPALAQDRSCTAPPARSLLPGGPGYVYPELKAQTLVQGQGPGRVQWLGASWFGPMNGRLHALDCAGTVLGAIESGYLRSLKPGPAVPGIGPTVLLEATTGTGTGYREDTARLVALVEREPKVLWEHVSLTRDSAQRGLGFEERFAWRFAPDGTRIEVTGTRQQDGKPGRAALPGASFCWKAGEKAFGAC